MKVSKEKMAEHREKILSSAAKRFRERGFDGIGVADIMKEADLTHGGFYGHFDSKEDLIAHATQSALSNSRDKWERILADAPNDPFNALTRHYLSPQHLKSPGGGCIFPSLGGELARQPVEVRRRVTEGLERTLRLLAAHVRGKTEALRRRKAIATYASLVGGMLLARSVSDPALASEILDAVAETVAT